MGAVLGISELHGKIREAKESGRQVVFTNGCFDLLHIGHIQLLRQARDLGDILVVGLNSDKSVRSLKGENRPLQIQSDRAEILSELRAVDFVIIFDDETPIRLIEQLRPDVLVKGGDWPIEQIVGGDFVQSYGGKVCSLDLVEGKSTTTILKKIQP